MGQEARGPERQLQRHPKRQPPADLLVGIDDDGRGASGSRRDPAPVQEGPAAAGDDVQGLPHGLPFVVVHVGRQIEDAARLERQVARLQELHPRLVGLAVGERRIRRHEQVPGGLGLGPALGEEEALPEVGAPQLAVDAPEVEARRERQRPVGRLLDRAVPREHEATRLSARRSRARSPRAPPTPRRPGAGTRRSRRRGGAGQARPRARSLRANPRDTDTGARGHGLRQVLERAPAEQAPEAVEAVVPVVVAGDAEQDAGSAVGRSLPQDRVPGPEQAALELVPAGQADRRYRLRR